MSSLREKRVVLGMSGGVDSSVAASLLKNLGFEVYGVSMRLYSCDNPLAKGCCTPKDRLDARRVCEELKVPFEIIDCRDNFFKFVIKYFAEEYAQGRTPLPCAPCNQFVRFKALLDYADSIQAQWIATGHYARVRQDTNGTFSLLRGVDPKKDQSYFLWGLSQRELSKLKLPIGEYQKNEVRALAREMGLLTCDKEESQDLCFVGDGKHASFLESHFPDTIPPAGDFVDEAGNIIGRHRGLHAYTIGQRRGLNISRGSRLYVTKLNPKENRILLGAKKDLQSSSLIAKNIHWISDSPPKGNLSSEVQIRSRHKGSQALLEFTEAGIRATFREPQEAITPGQAAVFYQGDLCLGGGWIERSICSDKF